MQNNDPFKMFEQALEAKLGVPEGLTEEAVELQTKSLFGAVFSALDKYNRILNFQAGDLSLSYKFSKTNRGARTTLCTIELIYGSSSVNIPILFGPDFVRANFPHLNNSSPRGTNEWSKSESREFIEALGGAIIKTFGPD